MQDLNDSLDNLFAGDTTPTGAPRVLPPQSYTKVQETYRENCQKCRGTGQFRGWSGRVFGTCFACQGKKAKTFKTSPAARAASREAQRVNRTRKAAEAELAIANEVAGFKHARPDIWAWLEANRGFSFAASLVVALNRYGHLTDNQIAAVERCIARDHNHAQVRQAREANAPETSSEGVDRLKLAFDTAIAYAADKGLKLRPKLTIGGFSISPAGANSVNPGALYVKSSASYLGKIANGRFVASRECTTEQQVEVLKFVADPKAAAEVYGQTTGTCCVCNATLTSEWKLRGIGPICAQKFGW